MASARMGNRPPLASQRRPGAKESGPIGPEGCGPEGCGPEGCGPEGCGPEGCGPEGCGAEGCGEIGNPPRRVEPPAELASGRAGPGGAGDAHDLRCGSGLGRGCTRAPPERGTPSACFGARPGISGGRCCSPRAVTAIISAEAIVCDRGRAASVGIRRSMNGGEQVTPEDVHVKFSAVELWRGRRLG